MKLPKTIRDLLVKIHTGTQCSWTRGYLERFLVDIKHLPENLPSASGNAVAKAKELLQDYETNPFDAVKRIRHWFGFTLLESKHLLDNYRDSGKIVWPEGYDPEIYTDEDEDDDGFFGQALVTR
jgi:hypothetical protein